MIPARQETTLTKDNIRLPQRSGYHIDKLKQRNSLQPALEPVSTDLDREVVALVALYGPQRITPTTSG